MDSELQKDLLALFPQDAQHDNTSMQQNQPGQSNAEHDLNQALGGYNSQANLDMLLMSSGMSPQQQHIQDQPSSSGVHNTANQAALDQQVKFARLKLLQVQHEILQQQIDLMSTSNSHAAPIDSRYSHAGYGHGLPTPASSTELRAQPAPSDFLSPMTLHHIDSRHYAPPPGHLPHMPPPLFIQPGMTLPLLPPPQQQQQQQQQHHQQTILMPAGPGSAHPSPRHQPQLWNSAPANLVFNTQPVGELNFDVSPISSPMFSATDGTGMSGFPGYAGPSGRQGAYPIVPMGRKRTASPGEHDSLSGNTIGRTRKRPAQTTSTLATPTTLTPSGAPRRNTRTAKSATSTPLLRGGRTRKSSAATATTLVVRDDVPTDSPSPVDLGMHPPAPPAGPAEDDHEQPAAPTPVQPSSPDQLMPVTPASIMNMSDLNLRSGLSPTDGMPGFEMDLQPPTPVPVPTPPSTTRARAASTSAVGPSARTRKATGAYKAILPAGGTTPSTPGFPSASSSSATAGLPVKKITNHKESEQKRRDSLKAAYDALRGLLPPIPLPTEDGGAALENGSVLPGALPPRGPPRGSNDGPNRGVSKLQLLRCGNAYIAALKGSVERRDGEMARLRGEVRRLQALHGNTDAEGEVFEVDRDVDEEDGPEGVTGAFLVNAAAAADDEAEDEA